MGNTLQRKIFLLSFIISLAIGASAQDYKFSQFYNSPLNLNPAMTGKINSLYRLVANYRLQYLPLQTPSPYNTLSASADFGLLRDKLRGDIFGVGLVFVNDRQSAILSNSVMISLGYNKSLGRNQNHFLSFGTQVGFTDRRLDLSNLSFQKQFTGTGFDLYADSGENLVELYHHGDHGKYANFIKPNLNLGILWSSQFTKMVGAYAGLSVFNVIRPKDSFFKSDNERSLRFNAHAGVLLDINKFVLISPNGMFMYQSKAMQWIAGTSAAFNLSGKSQPYKTAVSVGVWIDGNGKNNEISSDKVLSSIITSVAVSFSGLQIGLSYDATVKPDLSKAVKTFGALEASIIYTSPPLDKKRQWSPLLCPKF